MTDIPLYHPDRAASGMRPLKAWKHFRQLMLDKEDTSQVFHILEALRDRRFGKKAASFFTTAEGRKLLAERPYLPNLLDNHDALKQLPEGSVGRIYVDFMEREGLTAQGLVDEQLKVSGQQPYYEDKVQLFGERMRDTHDLHHILTGYGRDALGEQCVLAFSYSQSPSWGTLFIAWAGAREIRKYPRAAKYPIYQAVLEGQRNGKAAQSIGFQNIEALLAENLEEARARMGIKVPEFYHQCHEMMRADGVDPYDLLGQNAAVAGQTTSLREAA